MVIAILGRKQCGKTLFLSKLLDVKYVHAPTVDFHTHNVLLAHTTSTKTDFKPYTFLDCPADKVGDKTLVNKDADLYFMVVSEDSALDYEYYKDLKRLGKPVYVINTCDIVQSNSYPCLEVHNKQKLQDLLSGIYDYKGELKLGQKCIKPVILALNKPSIQLIGKVNAGKSTLFKRISKQDVLISPIAGSTKQGVRYELDDYVLVDTAGGRLDDQADIVIMVVDGSKGMLKSDKQMIDKVNGKVCIVAWNKCDLEQEKAPELGVPVLKISAQHQIGIDELLKRAQDLYAKSQKRISTKKVIEFIEEHKNQFHLVKVKHGVHVTLKPYKVVFFVNKIMQLKQIRKLFIKYFNLKGLKVIIKLKLS